MVYKSDKYRLEFHRVGFLRCLALLAFGICGSFFSLGATSAWAMSSQNEQAIINIEQAMAGEQSAESITANWSKDVVWFDMIQGNHFGLEAVRNELGKQIAQLTNIKVQILNMKVEASDTIAFAFSTQRLSGIGRNGAPDVAITFRQTDGFIKDSGNWRLVHQHISVPFDPTNGKAIMHPSVN